MMNSLLHILILLPIAGFLLSVGMPKNERAISWIAYITAGFHLLCTVALTMLWLLEKRHTVNIKDAALFKTGDYEFFIDFNFDHVTAVFLLVGSVLTFLVIAYSRVYMHRESGYKRFFNTILFFFLGYNFVVLSGNLETLFIGWEVLGISSFLLIAFYRDRYLPVKNALKVFSIYRIGDVGIILAMWLSHHLWRENITFIKLNNYALVHEYLQTHNQMGVFISLIILVSAAVKSAQLPFSSWLPRAMEGPTPSSAIFYGSLSVHLGVFLMLKTFPFWEHQISVRILIAGLGILTSVVASGIARVQSSVKAQIGYASISQIGLMFVEVAAGFETLALVHFAGNAFLRTYQLLVSPSVVSYLIREQFYNFVPRHHTFEDSLPKKMEYSLYVLCLKEWNLDSLMYRYLWNPLKWLGGRLDFMTVRGVSLFFIPFYIVGVFCAYHRDLVPAEVQHVLPPIFSAIGLIMVLKSFVKRKNAYLSWLLIIMSHFWIALAISFNEQFTFEHVYIYLSGIAVCGILGYVCLHRLKVMGTYVDLDQFHGYVYEYPKTAFAFLMACLGIAGFPITPSFIGEDLIFTHIHQNQFLLAITVSLSFIIAGLAIIRIYARIFLGPHTKSAYEKAYRSS